jgi:hypothetical protein
MVVGGLEHRVGVFASDDPPGEAALDRLPVASDLSEDPRLRVGVALGHPAGVLLAGVEAGVDHAGHEPAPVLEDPRGP